jgi:hypothetical protein
MACPGRPNCPLVSGDGELVSWWATNCLIGYTIRPTDHDELELLLNYRIAQRGEAAGEDVEIPVSLEITRPHLGGVRWWVRCPLVVNDRPCRRRVAILYLPPAEDY